MAENATQNLADNLPHSLWVRLQQLAETYEAQGANLFVFGSFAQGTQRHNSDLDLGVEWQGQPNPAIFRALQRHVDELPTVRKIDLVDFYSVDEAFKELAVQDRVFLAQTDMAETKKQSSIDKFDDVMARWQEVLQMPLSDIVRDAAILRFELTFEVGWKLIQLVGREHGYVINSPRQAFQTAFSMGWVTDEEVWADILTARNTAIHVYREAYAQALYEKLPRFYRAFAEFRQSISGS